ncbi:MAG: DUF5996 family protein [Microthrixaceae bacterium]
MDELSDRWPSIPVDEWSDTRDTLHLYLQVIGKVRIACEPLRNHWWNSTLYVTARGLTTSLMPHPTGPSFQIDLDLLDHVLIVDTTAGERRTLALEPRSVAEFHHELHRLLDELGVDVATWPVPVELSDAIPFPDDDVHDSYDPDAVRRFWQALVVIGEVFDRFRSEFLGKSSPVHLFFGAMDLAVTRFSGRTAPEYRGEVPNCGPHVMIEAYSHEVSSAGFWPGGPGAEGTFYAYAYPEPEGFRQAAVLPAEASWDDGLGEFVLPYEAVRTAEDPEAALLSFLRSTYVAAADLAEWDRAALER